MIHSVANADDRTLLLWDEVMVRIHRGGRHGEAPGSVELVAYPSSTMSVSFRQAREPYKCTLHLADGVKIWADLGLAEDWGDIREQAPTRRDFDGRIVPEWGNDEVGYTEIVRVTLEDGREIPLDEFMQDVIDFTIHHEG